MEKIDDNKATGFLLATLGVIVILSVWHRSSTLPADFLLGCLSAWCIRSATAYYKLAEKD